MDKNNIITADFLIEESSTNSNITLYINGDKKYFNTFGELTDFLDENNLSLHSDNIKWI